MGLVQFRADDDLPFFDLAREVGVVLALQLQRVVVVVVLDDEMEMAKDTLAATLADITPIST